MKLTTLADDIAHECARIAMVNQAGCLRSLGMTISETATNCAITKMAKKLKPAILRRLKGAK
jgi:hypothetical protein